MDQEIFNFFNKQIKKDFGKTASKETFAKFASYCAEGIEKNGVKPIFNWINLYAFGTGVIELRRTINHCFSEICTS
ncbi:hypothetical protein V2S99_05795 [Streptococcus agalactiae]